MELSQELKEIKSLKKGLMLNGIKGLRESAHPAKLPNKEKGLRKSVSS